jgi:glycine dehydrogenase subunit 1
VSYVAHTPDDVARMLRSVGASAIEELFGAIPDSLFTNAELKLERRLGERSLLALLGSLAERNQSSERCASFLGGGAYHHFIPAAVSALTGRGEFLTAYTPYQAELSQGTLQAIFEFQTLMCQLTGLEVANASMYDGASAMAEAALLALRATRRRRVLVSAGLHPHYLGVLRTYTSELDVEIVEIPLAADGRTARCEVPDDVAAVILQQPNFFGCIERVEAFAESAHRAGALLVTASPEPLALALLRPPGATGVDLACGEAQSFGVPLSFGGPYVGFLAARQTFVRQLPGRLVGETLDSEGARAFVMTLTTREQHIRRERATSNICTNQGLCALRVTVYLSLLGKLGLRKLAQINLSLAEYAKRKLAEVGVRTVYSAPTFNEFTVHVPGLAQRLETLVGAGVLGGVPLEPFSPARRDQLLVCTTEMNSREQIDRLAEALAP